MRGFFFHQIVTYWYFTCILKIWITINPQSDLAKRKFRIYLQNVKLLSLLAFKKRLQLKQSKSPSQPTFIEQSFTGSGIRFLKFFQLFNDKLLFRGRFFGIQHNPKTCGHSEEIKQECFPIVWQIHKIENI